MSFSEQIRRYAEAKKKSLDDAVSESLVNLCNSVIIKTPVDTGILANSWKPTNARPSNSRVPFKSPNEQNAQVEAKVGQSIGGVFYLVNNQPYAKRIEYDGWSEKAPAGMLRISIENYQQYLDQAINKSE